MSVLNVNNLSKSYADRPILDNVSFTVDKGVKAALLGQNGSGKSTLLNIIAGEIPQDDGEVIIAGTCKVSSLTQEDRWEGTVFDFMLDEYSDLMDMERQMQREISPEALDRLMIDYEKNGGYNYKANIKMVLKGLGFEEIYWNAEYRNLSGGQKVRLKLAKVLAGKGNILLLDEPTNHLDIKMITWLENFIRNTPKTVIFVSHDRRFVRNLADEILYLSGNKIKHIKLGYDDFKRYLNTEIKKSEKQRKLINNKRAELEEFVRKYRAGVKSKQVTVREKMLENIKKEEDELFANEKSSTAFFRFEKNTSENDEVLNVSQLTIGYGDNILKSNVNFSIYKGEKVALIGLNGTGKSTLLKIIMGEHKQISGAINIGNKVKIGYLDQNFSGLNKQNTVMEELLEISTALNQNDILNITSRFGFSADDMDKRIHVLSGGEKTRVCLIKLIFAGANFLIMDEPTNHLDIDGVEELKSALQEFNGAAFIVSHDRFFLDGIIDKAVVFNNKGVFVDNSSVDEIISRYALIYDEVNTKKNDKRKDIINNSNKRVNKFKVNEKEKIIFDIESRLEELYSERNKNLTDWKKLDEINKNIDYLEEDLIYKYDELEKLQKGEV
jgi:ATP-binding cassette subfamily F protein 3